MLWAAEQASAPPAPTAICCGMTSCRMCVCTYPACAGVSLFWACRYVQVFGWLLRPASLPITDISRQLLAVVSVYASLTRVVRPGLCLPAHGGSAACAACLARGWCRRRLCGLSVHLVVCVFNRLCWRAHQARCCWDGPCSHFMHYSLSGWHGAITARLGRLHGRLG